MTLQNNRASLICYFKLCVSFHTHWLNSNWSYSPETPNLGQIRQFLEPCDLEIWQMTLQNNRAPLLCYFKLCAAFRSHWWIQTGVTVRKHPIWVKTIGHLFYATSSYPLCYSPETPISIFLAIEICEFKLELQSGNVTQCGSKSMTLQNFFAVWPWNLRDDLQKH